MATTTSTELASAQALVYRLESDMSDLQSRLTKAKRELRRIQRRTI